MICLEKYGAIRYELESYNPLLDIVIITSITSFADNSISTTIRNTYFFIVLRRSLRVRNVSQFNTHIDKMTVSGSNLQLHNIELPGWSKPIILFLRGSIVSTKWINALIMKWWFISICNTSAIIKLLLHYLRRKISSIQNTTIRVSYNTIEFGAKYLNTHAL